MEALAFMILRTFNTASPKNFIVVNFAVKKHEGIM